MCGKRDHRSGTSSWLSLGSHQGATTSPYATPKPATRQPEDPGTYPGRTAPEMGIEPTGATLTGSEGFEACTIWPLPMYSATWLIGE